jgi:hypothetical protein
MMKKERGAKSRFLGSVDYFVLLLFQANEKYQLNIS